MSILVYDEIWVREPRLMVPRQFPIGSVGLDRSHPIGSRVSGFLLPNTNRRAAVGGAGITGTPNGPATLCNGSSQYFESVDKATLSNPFTLMVWAFAPAWAGNAAIISIGAVGTASRAVLYSTNIANRLAFFVAASDYSQWALTDAANFGGAYRSYAGTYISASAATLYVDGKTTSPGADRTLSNWASGGFNLMTNATRNNATISFYSSRNILGAIVVNGGLSDVEVLALHNDPGQIFIPA